MRVTRKRAIRRGAMGMLCAALLTLAGAASAQAAADDPIFVYTPVPIPFSPPIPPPASYFEDPCGLVVDPGGDFYVSDHHHHTVDAYTPAPTYMTQAKEVGPLSGPCGLALDSAQNLYVNDYHHDVVRLTPSPLPLSTATRWGPPTAIDSADPTGVAVDLATDTVYVDNRTYVSAYDSSGAPVEVGGEPLRIGDESLEDGYGLAFAGGRLYVPDAADGVVKIYEPALDPVHPVGTIDGHGVPGGGFNSLRDAAVAVDAVSGNVYVVDDLQPGVAEEPEAAVYVFDSAGAYLGRLKNNIVDSRPAGLAVDNSAEPTQGRVYVTSGNTEIASIYAYGPGAQTSTVIKAKKQLGEAPAGTSAPSKGAPSTSGRPSAAVAPGSGGDPQAGASEVSQKKNLRLTLGGKLSPSALPRTGVAPVAVAVDWKLATDDGSPVPPLKKVRIEINRHGRFDYAGLPTCPVDRIQPASSQRALSACRSALVGQGSFEAEIALSGQERYPATGKLLVFNGLSHGKHVLLGQIYSPKPFATSFVVAFAVEKVASGPYGTALTATLPAALSNWGNLTAVDMELSRRYKSGGTSHSYVSAGCPAPKGFPGASFPLTRTSFEFAGAPAMSETLNRSCKAR